MADMKNLKEAVTENICPKCNVKALKVSYHYPLDTHGNTRHRKEFHHASGSHTVEMHE